MFKVDGNGIEPYWAGYEGEFLTEPKFVIFLSTTGGEATLRPEFFKRFNGAVELQDGVEVPEEGAITLVSGLTIPPGVPLEDSDLP